jgi:hypothetical protein
LSRNKKRKILFICMGQFYLPAFFYFILASTMRDGHSHA